MSFTVVPIHNLKLPPGSRIPFGKTFILQDTPEWLKADKEWLGYLSRNDREATLAARHSWVAEYPAASMGEADPDWKGKSYRGIQDTKYQAAFLANLALWLSQPSKVCFTVVFQALTNGEGGRAYDPPLILKTDGEGPFYCHGDDEHNQVLPRHVIKAADLYAILETIPRGNPVWAALRAFSAALASYFVEYRFPLYWQGLDALFGSDSETSGVTKRLADRISFFLADDSKIQLELSQKVRDCYSMRSEIVHGRLEEGPEIEALTGTSEAICRTVMRHMLEKPGMIDAFISPKRNAWLETWVKSQGFTSPVLSNIVAIPKKAKKAAAKAKTP